MANVCAGCNKALNFFSGNTKLFDDTDIFLCDACLREIGVAVNIFKNRIRENPVVPSSVEEAYKNVMSCIECASSIQKKQIILSEIESRYQEFYSEHTDDYRIEQEENRKRRRAEREAAAKQRQQEQEAEREREIEREIKRKREEYIRALNPVYEYETQYLFDSVTGVIDKCKLDLLLSDYASRGWRLVSATMNEVGKDSFPVLGINLNATRDIMILVFERMILPASPDKIT